MILSDFIDARIHSEGYVTVRRGDFNKKISLKDYLSVIQPLVSENDQDLSNSAFRYPSSIHSVASTNDGYIVNLYYPERPAVLRHSNGDSYDVDMPNVMIRVTLRTVGGDKGKFSLASIYWYATDKDRIGLPLEWPSGTSSRDHIWTLPLPNMFNDARMCTGANQLPSVIYRDWTVLDMLYNDVLLGSAFNNDLSVCSLASGSTSGASWLYTLAGYKRDIIEEEGEGNSRFPYHLLTNY